MSTVPSSLAVEILWLCRSGTLQPSMNISRNAAISAGKGSASRVVAQPSIFICGSLFCRCRSGHDPAHGRRVSRERPQHEHDERKMHDQLREREADDILRTQPEHAE